MNPFRSCTQRKAIQLQPDSEDSDDGSGLTQCFGNCFPFNRHNHGPIRLPLNDEASDFAGQDDALIHPSHGNASSFERNVFDEPHRFLSRNPFAGVPNQASNTNDQGAPHPSDHDGVTTLGESSQIYRPPSIDDDLGQELTDVADGQSYAHLDDWTEQDPIEPPRALLRSSFHHFLVDEGSNDMEDQLSVTSNHDVASTQPNNPLLLSTPPQDTKEIADSDNTPENKCLLTESPILDPSTVAPYTLHDNTLDSQMPNNPTTDVAHPDTTILDISPDRDPAPTDGSSKRSSVAVVARTILGERLEDFTETLSFIKKSIIMGLEEDQDTEQDDPLSQANVRDATRMRRASYDPVRPAFDVSHGSVDEQGTAMRAGRHKRSSSLMDVAGPALSRLMQQIGGGTADHPGFSPSSLFATLAGPDVQRQNQQEDQDDDQQALDAHSLQRQSRHSRGYPLAHRTKGTAWEPTVPEAQIKEEAEEEEEGEEQDEALQEEDEDEDLFDFTKVIEIGKNVKSFSEDVVGNGLRLLNNVATQVRNASKEQDEHDNGTSNDWLLEQDGWM